MFKAKKKGKIKDMRKYIVAGNWKMNLLPNEALQLMENLAPQVKESNSEVIVCVPFTDLFYTLLAAQGTNIHVGAQICTGKKVVHTQEKYHQKC